MSRPGLNPYRLTPEAILRAYRLGVFPMANSRLDTAIQWVAPAARGVLPIDIQAMRIPRRLRKTVRRQPFEIRINTAFRRIIDACAAPRPGHPETWINKPIRSVFCDLHALGHAHSVEAWADDELVGGLYGLSIGGAFFGESMFSRRTEASKVALVHLVARLWARGFTLLDVQFVTDHLRQFGIIEVPNKVYLTLLDAAIDRQTDFYLGAGDGESNGDVAALLRQSITQTS